MSWFNWCCCDCKTDGFLYKRFPAGFGEGTPHTIELPLDDAGWPTDGSGCLRPRPNLNFHADGIHYHIGGRYYTEGSNTPEFDGGSSTGVNTFSMFGVNGRWAFVDATGRGYWFAYRSTAGGVRVNLEVYRYDPTLGLLTDPLNHTKVFELGDVGTFAELNRRGSFNGPAQGDIKGDRMLIVDPGKFISGSNPYGHRDWLVMVDLTTGEVLWSRDLHGNGILHEGAAATSDAGWWEVSYEGDEVDRNLFGTSSQNGGFQISSARIGDDGNVYIATSLTPITGNPTPVVPGFWKIDGTTGHLERAYGRYVGATPDIVGGEPFDAWPTVPKISWIRHFDVDSSGNVVLSLTAYEGVGIVRLEPTATATTERVAGDSDQTDYVALGYTESWFVDDGSGDTDTGRGGLDLLAPEWPIHDVLGSGPAYYVFRQCIRYTDGSSLAVWSRPWAQINLAGDPQPQKPAWMRRGNATGDVHTATAGGLVDEPNDVTCESVFDEIGTECCPDNPVPVVLDLSVTVTTPGSYDVLIGDGGNASESGGAIQWSWPVTVSGDCGATFDIIAQCKEVFPGMFAWVLIVDGTEWSATFTCDPFHLELVGTTVDGDGGLCNFQIDIDVDG